MLFPFGPFFNELLNVRWLKAERRASGPADLHRWQSGVAAGGMGSHPVFRNLKQIGYFCNGKQSLNCHGILLSASTQTQGFNPGIRAVQEVATPSRNRSTRVAQGTIQWLLAPGTRRFVPIVR